MRNESVRSSVTLLATILGACAVPPQIDRAEQAVVRRFDGAVATSERSADGDALTTLLDDRDGTFLGDMIGSARTGERAWALADGRAGVVPYTADLPLEQQAQELFELWSAAPAPDEDAAMVPYAQGCTGTSSSHAGCTCITLLCEDARGNLTLQVWCWGACGGGSGS